MAPVKIPASHLYLLQRASVATLSTLGADGSIQSSLVWFDFADALLRINTLESSPKAKNLARHPQGTLLIMDHAHSDTYLVLRCVVSQVSKEGAIAHLNRLTKLNMGLDRWYGGAVDDDPAGSAERIIIHLKPERIYAT